MSQNTPSSPLSEGEQTIPEPVSAGEAGEQASSGRGPLINRNFTLLAVGQAISNVGDFVFSTTLLVWVYTLTHSAAAISGVLFAQYLPIFLLGPLAGVFIDRWNRRTTMIVSDSARVVITLLPLIVPLPLRLPTIYASVFLLAMFSRFFMPARSGVLQVIVNAEQQGQAAAIGQATFALSIVIGPAIATPLYFLVGPIIACSINAASFLVSALCVSFIRAPRAKLFPYAYSKVERERGKHGRRGNIKPVLRELGSGFRFVATSPVLSIVTILALVAMLGAGALNALDVIFVTHNLHTSASLYGPLNAAGGCGALIGAVGIGLIVRKVQPKYILTGSVFLLGAGIIVYSLQTWFIAALIINFLIGIPNGGVEIGFGPLLINSTPQHMMGRAQSVIETGMYASSLISVALAGYLGQFIPVNIIFAIGGALLAIAGLFGWFAIPSQKPTATTDETNRVSVPAVESGGTQTQQRTS
jgi:MFS family permease